MKIILTLLIYIPFIQAEPFIPESDEVAVLSLSPETTAFAQNYQNNLAINDWQTISDKMDKAQTLFNEDMMDEAAWWLEQNTRPSVDWLFLKARYQQYHHDFAATEQTLNQIFKQAPNHVASRLIAARLSRIQADHKTAKSHCQLTIGHTDLVTSELCLLDSQTTKETLSDSVAAVIQLLSHKKLSETQKKWAHQMLSEWLLYLGQPEEALFWLQQSFNEQFIYDLDKWLQIQWLMNQDQIVLDKFEPYIKLAHALPDGFLVKLAASEKRHLQPTSHTPWQNAVVRRMALRAERHENLDARTMTEYHLFINQDYNQALIWANKNLKSSQEWYDHLLLEQITHE